jgi:hypothetical protein
MAAKYDFSECPEFNWAGALDSEPIRKVEAEGHGWQPARNEQYRVGWQIQEKLKRGESLTHKERGFALFLGLTADQVVTMTHHGDWAIKHAGLKTSEVRDNPTKHAQAYVDFHQEFGLDLMTYCAADCGSIDVEILGGSTMRPEDGTDQPTSLLIKNEKDAWKIREYIETTDIRKVGRMPARLEFFRELKRLGNDNLFLLAQHGGGPFAAAWLFCGYHNLMQWMKNKPQLLHLVLDVCTLYCMKIIDAFKEVEVHAFVNFLGTTGLPHIREWQGMEFAVPYGARLAGYAWPTPIIQYNWGSAFTIGTDPVNHDPKKMGTEEAWLRWQIRDIMGSGANMFFDLASDSDIPPGNNLALFRDLARYYKKPYKVGIHGEEIREASPEFITRKVVKWLLDMWPCEGGCCLRALYLDPIKCPVENVKAFTHAVKEFGTFPIEKAKLERYLKDHPGPLINYEVKGLEGELLKKEAIKSQAA